METGAQVAKRVRREELSFKILKSIRNKFEEMT
jgi:hypothetical protein